MEITIRPKNFKLPADAETHVRKRLDRLSRHLDGLESAEVTLAQEPTHLTPQRFQYVAQVTLRLRNNLIRSEVSNPELLTGVDEALANVSRQMERFKTRTDRRKKGAQGMGRSSADMMAQMPMPEGPSVVEMAAPAEVEGEAVAPKSKTRKSKAPQPAQTSDEEELGTVVKVKRFQVRPMFPEEAIEQMELLGHSFFIFWNASDERMSVVYRRRDGNYGVLEPELS